VNEFHSVLDRGPIIPAEQSGESWIVKSATVISDIGEFLTLCKLTTVQKLQ